MKEHNSRMKKVVKSEIEFGLPLNTCRCVNFQMIGTSDS